MNTVLPITRPARYRMGDDGRTHMLPDEPAAAEPSLPSAEAIGEVVRLTDAAGFPKRIAELKDAAAELRDREAKAKKAEADLAAREAAFAPAQAAHEQKLAGADLAHKQEMERRVRNVELREHATDKRERDLEKREAKVAADRARVDKKFAALRDAAAD